MEGIAVVSADHDSYPEIFAVNKAEKGCIQGVYGERLTQIANLLRGDDMWNAKGPKERGQRGQKMHATPVTDVVADNLCILKHRGLPNRYVAVKGIQSGTKHDGRSQMELRPMAAAGVFLMHPELRHRIKTNLVCGETA